MPVGTMRLVIWHDEKGTKHTKLWPSSRGLDSLSSSDKAFLEGFHSQTPRHIEAEHYPPGCLLTLDDVRAVVNGRIIHVLAPQQYDRIDDLHRCWGRELGLTNWKPETAEERARRVSRILQAHEEFMQDMGGMNEFARYNILNEERVGSFSGHHNKDAHPSVAYHFGRRPCDPAADHKLKGVAVTGSGSDIWLKVGKPLLTFYKQLELAEGYRLRAT